jgi:dephospho-CoA kinase
MPPIRIGLTGGVGMGKSSVAAALAEHGAQIVSGDELGRVALEQSPELLAAIRERFGDEVFSSDGTLQRRELGKRVFSSPEHVHWLTALTFPRIHWLWMEAVEQSARDVIVLDAAMIVEWGMEKEFDLLVVVMAPKNLVRERLMHAGRLTEEEAAARQEQQVAPAAKAAIADRVINNNGTLSELRRQLERFWQEMVTPELETRRKQRNAAGN